MSDYQKEKSKVLILLGIGIILLLAFLIWGGSKYHFGLSDILNPEGIFLFIAIICYPIGIVYGSRSMFDMYRRMRAGDRIGSFNNIGAITIATTIMWISIALTLTIVFGWIIGVVKAYKTLKFLKNN